MDRVTQAHSERNSSGRRSRGCGRRARKQSRSERGRSHPLGEGWDQAWQPLKRQLLGMVEVYDLEGDPTQRKPRDIERRSFGGVIDVQAKAPIVRIAFIRR